MVARQFGTFDGKLQTELSARAYGPILFDGREVVEVHRSPMQDGVIINKEIHWIGRDKDMIQCQLREMRQTGNPANGIDGRDFVESLSSVFPARIIPGYDAERTVRYHQGNYFAVETFRDRCTGCKLLEINGKQWNCLCLESYRIENEQLLLEIYISIDTGKVVLVRKRNAGKEESIQVVDWKE
ncbi:hypothetical protein K8T06_14850, partial [bacterium]|nr:hypothetical protein [bacterium]